VKTALEKHPALRAAGYQAAAAASGVEQARAGFFPRIDFSEGVVRSDNPVYAFGSLLNQGRFTSGDFAVDKLNHPDPITNWRTNLSGSVPLFLGGRTVLGYQQAQLGQNAAEQGRLRASRRIIQWVIRHPPLGKRWPGAAAVRPRRQTSPPPRRATMPASWWPPTRWLRA
jgi:outer membrane protein TolC